MAKEKESTENRGSAKMNRIGEQDRKIRTAFVRPLKSTNNITHIVFESDTLVSLSIRFDTLHISQPS